MIFINKDTANNFITRFEGKITLTNPYYLWKLTKVMSNNDNDDIYNVSKNSIYFMLTDTSAYENAYNLFTLTESPTGSTVGGINTPLALDGGQYEYEVYESSGLTLSTSAVTGTYIERDILVVEIEKTVNTSSSKINDIYY
jgi:hypothetical protein